MKTPEIVLLLILIIIISITYYCQQKQKQEPFIPAINRIYRPHARNARIYVTNKFSNITNQITSSIRKMGVI
jgi:hypothetical protein